MGTLAALVPVLGLLAGVIVAKLVPYELKQGEKYFKLLQHTLLIFVIGTIVWQRMNAQPLNIGVPVFLFFIPVGTRYHKNYVLLSGIAAAYIIIASISTV